MPLKNKKFFCRLFGLGYFCCDKGDRIHHKPAGGYAVRYDVAVDGASPFCSTWDTDAEEPKGWRTVLCLLHTAGKNLCHNMYIESCYEAFPQRVAAMV
jgi:hypothetical protein